VLAGPVRRSEKKAAKFRRSSIGVFRNIGFVLTDILVTLAAKAISRRLYHSPTKACDDPSLMNDIACALWTRVFTANPGAADSFHQT
jgi:hypothetical protein